MDQQVTHGTNLIHFKNKCIHYWIIFFLQDLLYAVFERLNVFSHCCFTRFSLLLHFNWTPSPFLQNDFSNICHSGLWSKLWRLIRSWGSPPPFFVKGFISILFVKSMNSVFWEREMAFRIREVGDPPGTLRAF